MVVDGWEEAERRRVYEMDGQSVSMDSSIPNSSMPIPIPQIPLLADPTQWGNDGLVPIQSAR